MQGLDTSSIRVESGHARFKGGMIRDNARQKWVGVRTLSPLRDS